MSKLALGLPRDFGSLSLQPFVQVHELRPGWVLASEPTVLLRRRVSAQNWHLSTQAELVSQDGTSAT